MLILASIEKPIRHHPHAPVTKLNTANLNGTKILIAPNKDFCGSRNEETLVLILVLNRLSSELQRNSIRATYGNFSSFREKINFKWKIIFLTGKPTTANDRDKISEESSLYGDILVTNVEDRYYSPVTLKMLIGFEFISDWFRNCGGIRYLVKTDDDVYLLLPKLEQIINAVITFY